MNSPRLSALILFLISYLTVSPHSPIRAQSSPVQLAVPQWQIDAGGHREFDIDSVKQNTSNDPRLHTNVGLNDLDEGPPNGGLFDAVRFPVTAYIWFAYKLTPSQAALVTPQLPKWAMTERFDIQARAEGNPTRNQMRLMVQSLLAKRFKLAVHYELRQVPVLEVVLDKPGKIGPRLIRLSDDVPCAVDAHANTGAAPAPAKYDGYLTPCGSIAGTLVSGRARTGSQNISMAQLVNQIGVVSFGALDLDRPLVDKTGLSGKFDFTIEFTPQFRGSPPANFQPDASGPTFIEALKEQLGLKLQPSTGPVDVMVVDHIEEPSPN